MLNVTAGGLMSYDASAEDSFRQVGTYVGRILTLNLTPSPGLLAIADEVIE